MIPLYQRKGSLKILKDYMHLAECITLLRENFAGKTFFLFSSVFLTSWFFNCVQILNKRKFLNKMMNTCSCGRFPPEVRTAIPVDGRFEHIILSCNALSDHAIIWIAQETHKALQVSLGSFLFYI